VALLVEDKTKLPLTIEVTKDSLSDTTRIFKLDGGSSGSDGSDGAPGADGAPAVTAFLTNESHTFQQINLVLYQVLQKVLLIWLYLLD
jgi:hypothetical protein